MSSRHKVSTRFTVKLKFTVARNNWSRGQHPLITKIPRKQFGCLEWDWFPFLPCHLVLGSLPKSLECLDLEKRKLASFSLPPSSQLCSKQGLVNASLNFHPSRQVCKKRLVLWRGKRGKKTKTRGFLMGQNKKTQRRKVKEELCHKWGKSFSPS